MPLGNRVQFNPEPDIKQKLFKLDTPNAFIECVSVLAHFIRNKKRLHVQIISEDQYKLAVTRKAYFCWLDEISGAADCDQSIPELHKKFKAKHLMELVCAKNAAFADMISFKIGAGATEEEINNLLSVADGGVTTHVIMKQFFNMCQREWLERFHQ